MTEQTIEVPLVLTEQQREDVLRFNATSEDGQDYDVPADRMVSLEFLGLVRALRGKRYEFTDAGLALVEAVRVAANDEDDVQELRKKLEHGTEPFAWIADYAACGGGRSVFTAEQAAHNTDAMCAKTPVYTLETLAAALAAIRTLEAKGYTYNGAEQWKPPVGAAPDFNLIDALRTDIERFKEGLANARGMLSTVAGCATSECVDCQDSAHLHIAAIDELLKPAEAARHD